MVLRLVEVWIPHSATQFPRESFRPAREANAKGLPRREALCGIYVRKSLLHSGPLTSRVSFSQRFTFFLHYLLSTESKLRFIGGLLGFESGTSSLTFPCLTTHLKVDFPAGVF